MTIVLSSSLNIIVDVITLFTLLTYIKVMNLYISNHFVDQFVINDHQLLYPSKQQQQKKTETKTYVKISQIFDYLQPVWKLRLLELLSCVCVCVVFFSNIYTDNGNYVS